MSTRKLTAPILAGLPLLRFLTPQARQLIARSFVPVSYEFGSVIVREGDDADALYVIESGTARVLKRGETGEDVPLSVLRDGDIFGEIGLLEHTTRTATVRASSEVDALRLDRSVFDALVRTNPELRESFERSIERRHRSNFFRLHTAFSVLPPGGLDELLDSVEPVHAEPGELVIHQGDESGGMYIVVEGRLRAFVESGDGEHADSAFFRRGDFFGARSTVRGGSRGASVEALETSELLALGPEPLRLLLDDYPELRTRVEQRVAQYDYRRVARVPLDFEELLPAEVGVQEAVLAEERADSTEEADAERGVERFEAKPGAELPQAGRVPVVWQLDEMDCGAACVAMVCRAFGRAVSLPAIREAVGTRIDGTSLMGIARGAEQVGLEARAVRASKNRLDELPLPAIVHWEGNHWIVLTEVAPRHVRVADPARGRRRLPRDEFEENWSGYAALLEPTPRLAEAPVARSNLRWLWPFFRPFRAHIAAAFVLALVVAGLQLLIPVVTGWVVDQVIPENDRGLLGLVLLGLCAVFVLIIATTILERYLLSVVAVRFDTASLDFLTGRLLDLPMSYFNTRRTGDIERRLAGVRQVRQFLVQSGAVFITAATQLAAALLLMFVYDWLLALVYLATVPLYAGLMLFSSRRLQPMFDSLEEAYGKYSSGQIDAIRGIETVKAGAAEDALRRVMVDQFGNLAQRLFRADFLIMTYQGAIQAVTFLSLTLFLCVGALQVMDGALSLGGFVAFNALVLLANGPVLTMLALWDEVQLSRILLARLNDVLEHEPEQGTDRSGLRPVRTLQGRVRLAGIGFRYGGSESHAILQDISFEAEPGTRVAIVGRSGSGKTTLMKCLAGLLEPTEGVIFYDGVDLRTLDYRTLRRQIGFVLQDSYLFDDTITRNIALGEDQPEQARVRRAARVAAADGFIERLPLGYDTRVGESGLRLSGGQAQRVAIARALYTEPPVLLFDEATSSLDTESERAIKENLDDLLAGRTSFVVAHRLSTVRDADTILVLERGRLVEQGAHDELMARRGLYFYLLSQQLEL